MDHTLQRCAICGGLQSEQYMTRVSGMWHCRICTERVLYEESRSHDEPEWMRRRRLQGMPSKDMTYTH